jgi:hypothetical protein
VDAEVHEELLWARRCLRCGWLDRSHEVAADEQPPAVPGDGWRCDRCGAGEYEYASTVGG